MANRNWASGGKIYSMHKEPVLLDCNFVVDDSSVNGISSLKGPTISNVYMHTSASPSSTNPADGTIVVRFADSYSRSFSGFYSITSPLSGSPSSSVVIGESYVISSLGSASPSQWLAVGMSLGVTPALGVSFVASSSGVIGGSAQVDVSSALGSNVASIEYLGHPNLSINPDPSDNQGYGAQFIFQCRDYQGDIVAPNNGSIISLAFYLSNSSITVQGE